MRRDLLTAGPRHGPPTAWRRKLSTAVLLTALSGCEAEAPPALAASTGEPSAPTGTTLAPEDIRPLTLPVLTACDLAGPTPDSIRVLSWNIGATRGSSLAEVRAVLRDADADVVLLQEVDVGVRRTGDVDQPRVLADELGYAYGFAAALKWDGGDFGLAILSRLPFASARRISLDAEGAFEPRIAFDAALCAGARELRFVDVHADFIADANAINLAELAAELGDLRFADAVVAGDLNAEPAAQSVVALIARTGTVDTFANRDPGPTRGEKRIDFMLASGAIDAAATSATRLQTTASDHRPLLFEFDL